MNRHHGSPESDHSRAAGRQGVAVRDAGSRARRPSQRRQQYRGQVEIDEEAGVCIRSWSRPWSWTRTRSNPVTRSRSKKRRTSIEAQDRRRCARAQVRRIRPQRHRAREAGLGAARPRGRGAADLRSTRRASARSSPAPCGAGSHRRPGHSVRPRLSCLGEHSPRALASGLPIKAYVPRCSMSPRDRR